MMTIGLDFRRANSCRSSPQIALQQPPATPRCKGREQIPSRGQDETTVMPPDQRAEDCRGPELVDPERMLPARPDRGDGGSHLRPKPVGRTRNMPTHGHDQVAASRMIAPKRKITGRLASTRRASGRSASPVGGAGRDRGHQRLAELQAGGSGQGSAPEVGQKVGSDPHDGARDPGRSPRSAARSRS